MWRERDGGAWSFPKSTQQQQQHKNAHIKIEQAEIVEWEWVQGERQKAAFVLDLGQTRGELAGCFGEPHRHIVLLTTLVHRFQEPVNSQE